MLQPAPRRRTSPSAPVPRTSRQLPVFVDERERRGWHVRIFIMGVVALFVLLLGLLVWGLTVGAQTPVGWTSEPGARPSMVSSGG